MADLKDTLLEDIKSKIAYRAKHENLDFMKAQVLQWSAILTSFGSAIATILKFPSEFNATLAALSGIFILIEKSFSYSKRSSWNAGYRINLEKLRNQLLSPNSNPEEIGNKLSDLELQMSSTFPGMQGQAPQQNQPTLQNPLTRQNPPQQTNQP